jgi:hypothetical protein
MWFNPTHPNQRLDLSLLRDSLTARLLLVLPPHMLTGCLKRHTDQLGTTGEPSLWGSFAPWTISKFQTQILGFRYAINPCIN